MPPTGALRSWFRRIKDNLMGARAAPALLLAFGLAIASPAVAAGEDQENLAPYKMLRSLQFVQDVVALGDSWPARCSASCWAR